MIRIEFVGAAQTVTGSKHLVHTDHATVLLDCGLFQGRRRESYDVNKELGFDASSVDVAVLSHAHIDHSGALPMLCKNGFDGTIYATPATRDLCAVMLEDAAAIQKQDAEYINRAIEREHIDMDPASPLYEARDVVTVLERMISVPYARTVHIADGIKLTFHDAGHVLGSAITVLDVEDEGKKKRIVFTGDLGRNKIPILRDPELGPDYVSRQDPQRAVHRHVTQLERLGYRADVVANGQEHRGPSRRKRGKFSDGADDRPHEVQNRL